MFTVPMKTPCLWLVFLLGAGVLAGCSKQTGGGGSSDLELQAARQSVKQLQDQLSQVSAEMSDRIRKEGERVRAEMKPQVDQAAAELAKARQQVAHLEARAKELEALARDAASQASVTNTVDPLAIPSDLFLSDSGQQAPGIAVRLSDGNLVVRTASGTLATNNIATIREINFRSGPVLAGVAATNAVVAVTKKPLVKPYRPPGSGVKLSPYWRAPVPGGDLIVKDLRTLLAERAQPKAELGVFESLEIFGGVYYQMPVQEAFKVLGKRPTAARKPIEAAGFPKQSLFYHELAGKFGDNFPGLLLITDAADQVLAIQLSNDALSEKLGEEEYVKDEGFMFHNLVKGRKKPNINYFINYRSKVINETLVLDSRLYDPNAAAPRKLEEWERNKREYMRMKERHILYLPQPVANLVSLCLNFY